MLTSCISMYDRTVKPIPRRPTQGLRYRIETLVGVTGLKMARYRASWSSAIWSPLHVLWRPHLLGVLFFEVSQEAVFTTNPQDLI